MVPAPIEFSNFFLHEYSSDKACMVEIGLRRIVVIIAKLECWGLGLIQAACAVSSPDLDASRGHRTAALA